MLQSSKKTTHPVYLSRAGWNSLLPERTVSKHPLTARRVKSLVIGGGYTGLAAARRLAELEPDSEVVVLEASEIGEGAAGRNSGFLNRLPNRPIANEHGDVAETARRQMRLYSAGTAWLSELVQKHSISCDWDDVSPRISAAATDEGVTALQATAKRYLSWGLTCETLSQGDLQARLGTNYYKFGFSTPYNTFVQPAALIRGLADSLPANVHLIENLPALNIREGKTYKVNTSIGEFECDRLILANNSFAKRLGVLSSRLITIFTYAGLTEPLDDSEFSLLGNEPSWGVIPAHRLGSTLRKVRGGRFMVRSAYSYERELPAEHASSMLSELYKNRYAHLRSHKFETVWGGCTALTRNGAPFFGRVRPGLYASVGCNGSGVLRGSIQGRLLAEMACGQDSDLLSDQLKLAGPTWIPPEPIRKIGVLSVIAMEQRKAGLER
ncbi:FAD-binding oxidoreductase [Pusillimonas sp. ANT_WB101]|uniref:NAD(P)/FAD-dependent oxidoreductase n=1 Tax=Pusillimonas sp. ANT_WB101 TaxID=2597356 RepID=UPI0011ECE577|nr:FAD-binding oxidoreductase [Pusillimonas sp. ANT_WB101]KAA0911342.1 FAD-binding oxidoreductase [Pusillimonas sp. ANT_WB101]